MTIVAASGWAQASTDSIEAEGVRFGTGASIGTITEKMRITQAGLVGIGTSAPSTSLYVNGQIGGGFGAMSTSGVLDWNDISNARSGNGYTLLRSSTASNAPIPGSSAYFHPFSFEYNAKDGGNNLTQFAIPYTDNGSIGYGLFYRGRYAGSWSGWHRLVVTTTSNTTGINTVTPSAALDVVGNVSVSGVIDVGHSTLACSTTISGSIRYETVSDTLQICTSAGWKSLASSTIASGGSISAASSTGAIQFNSGNALAGDTSNLFWDDANNRLGIGTSSPAHPLDMSSSYGQKINIYSGVTIGLGLQSGLFEFIGNSAATAYTFGYGSSGSLTRLMTILGGGNVGIGVTSPEGKLDIRGAGTTKLDYTDGDSLGAALVIRDTAGGQQNGGQILFGGSSGLFAGIKGELRSGSGPAGNIIFQTRNTSGDILRRMAIFYSGGGGIGISNTTTNVATTLMVAGSFAVSNSAQTTNPSFYVGTDGRVGLGTTTPTVALHVVGDIAYTGVMSDVSDRRMKRDIATLGDAVADRLMLLKPVTFRMKDADATEYGFIAQDVKQVFPELVREGEILSLNYVGLIAPAVKTIQLLKRENDEQGDRIDALAEQNRLLRLQVKELMLETRKTQREMERLTGVVH